MLMDAQRAPQHFASALKKVSEFHQQYLNNIQTIRLEFLFI
jgi:hypothetical protein